MTSADAGRKKKQSFAMRCTEPVCCPVVCELSVVTRSPLPLCHRDGGTK